MRFDANISCPTFIKFVMLMNLNYLAIRHLCSCLRSGNAKAFFKFLLITESRVKFRRRTLGFPVTFHLHELQLIDRAMSYDGTREFTKTRPGHYNKISLPKQRYE